MSLRHIATTSFSEDELGRVTVVITFADGRLREVSSSDWTSIISAAEFAGRLIANESARLKTLAEIP